MVIKLLAFLLMVAFQSPVLGCSPVKSMGVRFDWNSSRIAAEQVLRVGSWMADQRSRYPNREAIYFSASADQEEHRPEGLARERAHALQKLVNDLDFMADGMHLPDKVEVVAAGSFGPGTGNDVKRAQIELLPGCPHECACPMP